jgi:hypothetical protein
MRIANIDSCSPLGYNLGVTRYCALVTYAGVYKHVVDWKSGNSKPRTCILYAEVNQAVALQAT